MGLQTGGGRNIRGLRNLSSISAIPDSEDLHAHYDFREYQSSQTSGFDDLSGNGHDLNNGSISGVTESINGNQAAELDGVDDSVWTDSFLAVDNPYTIAYVADLDSDSATEFNVAVNTNDSDATDIDHRSDPHNHILAEDDTDPDDNLIGGSETDNLVVHLRDADGNATLRVNGTEVDTGSQGADMDLIGIGSRNPRDNDRFFPGAFGELLVYPMDKSDSFGEIESYLNGEWSLGL